MKKITRRTIIKIAPLLVAAPLINFQDILQDERSSCCMTPEIENESCTIMAGQLVIDLNKALTLKDKGNSAFFKNDGLALNMVIIHVNNGQYVALSRSCTHAGRMISYVGERKVLMCNNFGHSTYSLQGDVVKGPAEKPLKNYAVDLNHDKLTIFI